MLALKGSTTKASRDLLNSVSLAVQTNGWYKGKLETYLLYPPAVSLRDQRVTEMTRQLHSMTLYSHAHVEQMLGMSHELANWSASLPPDYVAPLFQMYAARGMRLAELWLADPTATSEEVHMTNLERMLAECAIFQPQEPRVTRLQEELSAGKAKNANKNHWMAVEKLADELLGVSEGAVVDRKDDEIWPAVGKLATAMSKVQSKAEIPKDQVKQMHEVAKKCLEFAGYKMVQDGVLQEENTKSIMVVLKAMKTKEMDYLGSLLQTLVHLQESLGVLQPLVDHDGPESVYDIMAQDVELEKLSVFARCHAAVQEKFQQKLVPTPREFCYLEVTWRDHCKYKCDVVLKMLAGLKTRCERNVDEMLQEVKKNAPELPVKGLHIDGQDLVDVKDLFDKGKRTIFSVPPGVVQQSVSTLQQVAFIVRNQP